MLRLYIFAVFSSCWLPIALCVLNVYYSIETDSPCYWVNFGRANTKLERNFKFRRVSRYKKQFAVHNKKHMLFNQKK